MTILSNDPLDLSGTDGEVITVTVTKSKAQVDLLLNGTPFTGNSFTLNRAKNNPVLLTAGGVYTDNKKGGGAFSVSLFSGGVVATKAVAQSSSAEARRAFTFTIDIA